MSKNDPRSEVLLDLRKGRIAPIESLDGEENVEKKYGAKIRNWIMRVKRESAGRSEVKVATRDDGFGVFHKA